LVQWLRSKKIAEGGLSVALIAANLATDRSGFPRASADARRVGFLRDASLIRMSFLTLTRLETKHGQSVRR
jgi:hypothetical protein